VSVANDTFSDTHPTNLTSHTSDSGHTWAATPGSANTLIIDAYTNGTGVATAANNGSTGEAIISRAPTTADYTVSIDLVVDGGNTFDFPGVLLRASNSADTCYRCYLNSAGSSLVQVVTDKLVAGSYTAIGSSTGTVPFHAGETLRLTVSISGSTISITLLNVTTSSSTTDTQTDSTITAAGQAGIMHQFQTGGPYQVITAFSLDETVGGSTNSYYYQFSQGLI